MLWSSFICSRYESQFFSPTFLVRAQWEHNLRVRANMPPFSNIVTGVVQPKQAATVVCWTGSISYHLSVFWFMYPLHCCTAVLIFYQKHITGFLLAEHLQQFKPSQASHLNTFSGSVNCVAVLLCVLMPHMTFTPITLFYSISQSGSVEMLSPLLSMMPKQKWLF